MTRYRCVDDQKAAGFPVTAACEAAGVSTSGFYEWRQRVEAGPTDRQVAEAQLVALMREIFDAGDGPYGVPRMTTELRRAGLAVNKKRVHRLMRSAQRGDAQTLLKGRSTPRAISAERQISDSAGAALR